MDSMTPDTTLNRVAELFEVTRADLVGRSRTGRIVQARFAAAYALHHHYADMSLSAIGAALGGRNHSTIINAIRRAEALARIDPDYRTKLHTLSSGPSPPEAYGPPLSPPLLSTATRF
jgi:chromosomal replication initiator protein